MKLPNGMMFTGPEHFDLNQLDKVFDGLYMDTTWKPKTKKGEEIFEDMAGFTFVSVITEMLAEVGTSNHRAVRSAEAMAYLFDQFTIPGIQFLGCYCKSSHIPETYVDQIEHVIFVFEFTSTF